MKGSLLLIIVVAIVFFILDALTNKCVQRDIKAIPLTLLHHFLYTFAILGWMLDDPVVLLVYISIPLFIRLHWVTNKNRCMVDEVTSNICGEDTKFNHLSNQLNLPNWFVNTLVGIGVVIAIVKLVKILKTNKPGPPPSMRPPWCKSTRCRGTRCK